MIDMIDEYCKLCEREAHYYLGTFWAFTRHHLNKKSAPSRAKGAEQIARLYGHFRQTVWVKSLDHSTRIA